jgi:hypothetical protein
MKKTSSWSGTISELRAALEAEGANPKLLPSAPNAVSHEMNRAAPVLRRLGIEYRSDSNTRTRIKHLQRIDPPARPEKTATTATTALVERTPPTSSTGTPSGDSGSSGDSHTETPGWDDVDPEEIERLAALYWKYRALDDGSRDAGPNAT